MIYSDDMFEKLSSDAENFSRALDGMTEIDSDLIKFGLNHTYDVIVSEAIDYLISRKYLSVFRRELQSLSRLTDSGLVLCRLRLCDAIENLNVPELSRKCREISEDYNYVIWDWAGSYIETGDKKFVDKILNNMFLGDERSKSLSRNVLGMALRAR